MIKQKLGIITADYLEEVKTKSAAKSAPMVRFVSLRRSSLEQITTLPGFNSR